MTGPEKPIPVAGPWVTDREIEYVADAARNAWYENANLYNARFEEAFASFTGRRFAISLPSCTAALHLSMAALGVGPGDEVIVPDVTWIASVAPITYVGATPVFADIDRWSWCIDADSMESLITERTKAIIPVDLYGNMPDYDAVMTVAQRHGIPVIEDAAEAHGSVYKGAAAGKFGVAGTFSFHGSKTLTTGEGGMLVTDDEGFHRRCLFLRDHGRNPGDVTFRSSEVAFKYKMSSLQAAFGLAQVERIDELVARKREIFSWYAEELGDDARVTLNGEAEGVVNTYWMVTAIVDPEVALPKAALMAKMAERNVTTRPMFDPLSDIPAFAPTPEAARARQRNRVSYTIAPRGINLPSGFNLAREDVVYVCNALKAVLDEAT